MEHFDGIVTDPRLKLANLYKYIEALTDDDYYLDEYRILTTSGSTGVKGLFVFDRTAWATLIAGVNRGIAMMGIPASRRMRIASIGANSPLHLSYRRAISMDFGTHEYRRLEATQRIEDLVTALNEFQPDLIHAYATIACLLAAAQRQGRLCITPTYIVTSAESLTEHTRSQIRKTWNVSPFNSYSTTEGLLGIECAYHRGIHLFEDLCLVEVVDEHNRPVPDHAPGHKILFTNLYQYTQPIIRYEISDMMTVSSTACPCGRPFRRIVSMEGRNDDIIYLEGTQGGVKAVPPYFFHGPMATLHDIAEYQIIHKADGLHFRIVVPRDARRDTITHALRTEMEREFAAYGVRCPPVHVEFISRLERDIHTMGKIKLVKKEV